MACEQVEAAWSPAVFLRRSTFPYCLRVPLHTVDAAAAASGAVARSPAIVVELPVRVISSRGRMNPETAC